MHKFLNLVSGVSCEINNVNAHSHKSCRLLLWLCKLMDLVDNICILSDWCIVISLKLSCEGINLFHAVRSLKDSQTSIIAGTSYCFRGVDGFNRWNSHF